MFVCVCVGLHRLVLETSLSANRHPRLIAVTLIWLSCLLFAFELYFLFFILLFLVYLRSTICSSIFYPCPFRHWSGHTKMHSVLKQYFSEYAKYILIFLILFYTGCWMRCERAEEPNSSNGHLSNTQVLMSVTEREIVYVCVWETHRQQIKFTIILCLSDYWLGC